MLSQGMSCKMVVGPSAWGKRKICLIVPLIFLRVVPLQLILCVPVCTGANKDSAELQILWELHSPEAAGMVVERSSVTPML